MRVPTEKLVPTIRIEVEFPAALNVSAIEEKAGWKVEQKKDASDKFVGAVLTGSIPTGESTEFVFAAQNPHKAGNVVIQGEGII